MNRESRRLAPMKSSTRDGVLRGGYAAVIRLLLVAAAGVSGYLLSVSLSGGNAVGCAPGSACDAVLQSRWAYVLGIPVSAFALILDGALLLTTFSLGGKSSPPQRRKAWELSFPAAMLVIGAALWFIALQLVVLKRLCPWCMTAHVAGSTAAVLLLLRFPMKERVERPEKDPSVLKGTTLKLGVIALILFALFAIAQIVIAPRTFVVENIPAGTTGATNLASTTTAPAARAAQTNAAGTATLQRPFGVFGGAITIDLAQVPLWGSPDAPHKLVSLFDYSCHHCAIMHARVADIAKQLGPKLAVISLPMPLDRKCNPLITRVIRAHENACEYARIGLALWRTKPSAVEAYDDWFFDIFNRSSAGGQEAKPPTVDEARNRAIYLSGDAAKFEAALRDPWIDQQLAASVAIFGTSWKQYRNGSMPQFIIGTNLVSGTLETAQLKAIVDKYVNAAP